MANNTKNDLNIDEVGEDWATYLTIIENEQVAAVLVDLSFNSIAPVVNKPNLICISIPMKAPREDGLSSSEESITLNRIEDEVINSITENSNANYVGRVNSQGKIVSHFYSTEAENIEEILSNINSRQTDYKFTYEIIDDQKWSFYLDVLYPQPMEMQIIQNSRVIENLKEHGDKLEKERQIDHWIYFKTENDRKNFLNEIKEKDFNIVEMNATDDDERKFSLQLSRIDKVDYESVDEYTLFLWQTAQDFEGEYDGWETFVIKD